MKKEKILSTERDRKIFFDALFSNEPIQTNQPLKEAFKKHKRKIKDPR
jgi:hypothetical protein